jgi:hypothetical protein
MSYFADFASLRVLAPLNDPCQLAGQPRFAMVERPRGEESPGSTETRRRITSGGGDPRESATEIEPPGMPGKGEKVG